MRRMDAQTGGHSLQELLITLGLVSILYATTIPMLRPPGAKDEAGRFTQALTRALNQARGIAVASGERVMFCGSLDGRKCSRVWPGDVELLVFTDRDNNRQLSEADTLHLQQPLRLQHARGVWRGSLARPYLRFRATGTARMATQRALHNAARWMVRADISSPFARSHSHSLHIPILVVDVNDETIDDQSHCLFVSRDRNKHRETPRQPGNPVEHTGSQFSRRTVSDQYKTYTKTTYDNLERKILPVV